MSFRRSFDRLIGAGEYQRCAHAQLNGASLPSADCIESLPAAA